MVLEYCETQLEICLLYTSGNCYGNRSGQKKTQPRLDTFQLIMRLFVKENSFTRYLKAMIVLGSDTLVKHIAFSALEIILIACFPFLQTTIYSFVDFNRDD